MTASSTWRIKSGIIMFHLTMPSNADSAAAIRRASAAFMDDVAAIGTPCNVAVSTRSGGEYAAEWTGVTDSTELARRLEHYADVTGVEIGCDLHCEDRGGGSFVIRSGLGFWVRLAEVDSPPDEPLELNVTLDTDVYLSKTWGEDRDNRELAALNAPRFNRFLVGLVRDTGATIESVSADDYPDQVNASGVV